MRIGFNLPQFGNRVHHPEAVAVFVHQGRTDGHGQPLGRKPTVGPNRSRGQLSRHHSVPEGVPVGSLAR